MGGGLPGGFLQTQPETGGAARPALRFALQTRGGGLEGVSVIFAFQNSGGQMLQHLPLIIQSFLVFLPGLDVRPVKQDGHIEKAGEIFQHITAARPAAAMQQQTGLFPAKQLQGAVGFQLVIHVFLFLSFFSIIPLFLSAVKLCPAAASGSGDRKKQLQFPRKTDKIGMPLMKECF